MRDGIRLVTMAVLLTIDGSMSSAAKPAPAIDRDKLLAGLATCHAVGDVAQRAACYDREYANLQQAVTKGDVVVMDRESVRKTRQSLFGFSLPSLAIFGDGASKAGDSEELKEITATLRSAQTDRDGHWVFQLDDGSTWHQMSDDVLGRRPKPGETITIRRASLGSFVLRVGNQPGFKARREN